MGRIVTIIAPKNLLKQQFRIYQYMHAWMATPPSNSLLQSYDMIHNLHFTSSSVAKAESIVVINRANQQVKTKSTEDFVNVALVHA